jgi:hypothetical protein
LFYKWKVVFSFKSLISLLGLSASKFKDQLYFQKDITQDQDIFRVVIDREEVENIFPSFKNNHLIKKRLNKVAQETKANSAIAIPIIEGDEVGFRFIPIIDSIKYNHTSIVNIEFLIITLT